MVNNMAKHETVDFSTIIENLNHFSHLPTKNFVDIEFEDLTYSVLYGRKTSKVILDGVCGKFVSGQLTAILGPSGAGKTTLLNMLAGLERGESSGTILVNGLERNGKEFKKISRYITQNDYIQPYLTVEESMIVAANLKLGCNETKANKSILIHEIINSLNLSGCDNTLAKDLSGGERKRLSIALELIDNPSVIFLDEPTTGLDDVACSQCISLLKCLANAGKTVICALHTPSAKLFSIFDNVYIVSKGQCAYQGYGPSVVPFLQTIGLDCPTSHNPADFIIEVCSQEYGDFQKKLVTMLENGRLTINHDEVVERSYKDNNSKNESLLNQNFEDMKGTGSTFFEQINILARRMWLQMWRDKARFITKFLVYLLAALLIGNTYLGMGNDGSKSLYNFGFFYVSIIFLAYVPMMPVLLWFPLEINKLKREYFNEWYGLGAYYMALTISTVPIQMLYTFIYFSITYGLSNQPRDIDRIISFYFICLLTSLVAESVGLLVGAVFNVVNSYFVGMSCKASFLLLGFYGFGSGSENIPQWIKLSMAFSYLRYSLEGLMCTMFRNRPIVSCPEQAEWCLYTDVSYFLREMGMEKSILWRQFAGLIFFLILFRVVGFYLLKQRLTPYKSLSRANVVVRFVKSYMRP